MLYHYAKLPSNAIAMIGNALHERSGPNGGGWSKLYTASSLVSLVARDGSDEALDWVLAWADGQKRCSKRADAVEALEDFRQPRAAKALRAFLKDSDPDVRYGAAAALARRRDPSAIETLIAITGDKESPWGCMAYYLLAIFPNDPRVLPVIEAAAQDSGARFHTQALSALESLRDAQKH